MINLNWNTFISNKTFKQSAILSVSNIFAMAMGFIITLILPKMLGSYEYGIFTLTCAVISLLSIFFEFGIFVSAARILVKTNHVEEQGQIIALSIRVLGMIAIVFTIVTYLTGQVIDFILPDKIGCYLIGTCFLSIAMVLPFASEQLLAGSNQIYKLSLLNILTKFLYLGTVVLGAYMNIISVFFSVYAFLATPIIGFVIVFHRYAKMKIRNKRKLIDEIISMNKQFGIKNYYSRLISTIASQLNQIIIGCFCGAVDVGLFSLTAALGRPVYLILQAISISRFKSFGGFTSFDKSFIHSYRLIIFAASLACWCISYFLFEFYYKEQYENGFFIMSLMIIAIAFQAAYVLYNNWLAANGLGKEMWILARNFGIISVTGNIILIFEFGVYGAVFVLVVGNIYILLHSVYYYKNKECLNESIIS